MSLGAARIILSGKSRGLSLVSDWRGHAVPEAGPRDLVGGKPPIGSMSDDGLTRLGVKLFVIDRHVYFVWLKRDEARDAIDFPVRLQIWFPAGLLCVAKVVVAAQALVRTERLLFVGNQWAGVDIFARQVAACGAKPDS